MPPTPAISFRAIVLLRLSSAPQTSFHRADGAENRPDIFPHRAAVRDLRHIQPCTMPFKIALQVLQHFRNVPLWSATFSRFPPQGYVHSKPDGPYLPPM